ncbi:far upstream element-binding protein 3 [Triticum aestivum]|uniref:far upstream element-binding protein 3 n=1 Tax=Triticum aestivum TaxID=4565 RepID=UPI00084282AF|nr:far upstream element-binding protein 3-like [Triticum aestivum]
MLCSSEVNIPKECSEHRQEDNVPSPEQQSAVGLTQEVTRKIEITQSKVDVGDSCTPAARSFGTPRSGAEQADIHVPNEKAGLVIGEGGETIKALKTKSGSDIQLIPQHLPEGDLSTERKIRLTGNWNQIEIARTMVLELISQSPGSSLQTEPSRAPQCVVDNGYDCPGDMYYQNPQYHLDGGTGQAPYQGGCYDYYASYNIYSARGPPSGVQAPMYDSARGPSGAQAPIHYRNWSPQVPVGYTSSYQHSAPGQLTYAQGYDNGQCHGQQSMNFQPVYQSYPPQQDPYGKSAFGGAQLQGYDIPMPGTNYHGPTPAQQPYALQSSTVPPQPGLGYGQSYGATAGAIHGYVQSSSGCQQPASQATSAYPQQVMQPDVYGQYPSTQPGYTDQAIANNANYHQQPASHVALAYPQQGMLPGVYWQYPSTQPVYTNHAVANNENYQQLACHAAAAYPQQGSQPGVYGQHPLYTGQAGANNPGNAAGSVDPAGVH